MRINLLQLGTQGVDMKTNPLLLTNQKLRAATNLAFDEGVIRTRPGFRYESWGATGQFQGAGEFRPRVGISSNTLSISGLGKCSTTWIACASDTDSSLKGSFVKSHPTSGNVPVQFSA